MAYEAAEILTMLPEAVRPFAAGFLFVGTAVAGWVVVLWSKKKESEKPDEHFDAEDLLESSHIKAFLNNVQTLADNSRLQTEALKNISAAATAMGKTIEVDYDERRVNREVERRLAEEKMRRDMRS